jgi:hypothetical protein
MTREVIKTRKRAAKPSAALQIAASAAPPELSGPSKMISIDADRRRALIAEAAYYRSLAHPSTGSEVEDWLAAEQEVDSRLMAHSS